VLRKVLILTLLAFHLSGFRVCAQTSPFYASTITGDIYFIDPVNCTSSLVVNTGTGLLDMAVCGNTLYAIDGGSLLSIDPVTGVITNLGVLPSNFNSLVCDGNGTLYGCDAFLYAYDIVTGVWTTVGPQPSGSAGDLTFFGGNLYITDGLGDLIQITLNPYSVSLATSISIVQFWGLATLAGPNCVQPEVIIGGDLGSVYTVDPFTGQISVLCANVIPDVITGLAAVPVPPGAGFTLQPVTAQPQCFGDANGTVGVNVLGGTQPFSYFWPLSGDTLSTLVNVGTGLYPCIVTDALGCSDTILIFLTQPTAVTVSANTFPAALCAGSSATLNANGSGGTGIISYLWQPGALAGNQINPLVGQTTTFTVTATDQLGCTGSASTTVTVYPQPVAGFTVAQPLVCVDNVAVFNNTSTVQLPELITSLNWSFSNGATATGQLAAIGVNAPGTLDATLIVTTLNGCTDTIQLPAAVTVLPPPQAAFVQAASFGSNQATVVFTDQSSGAATWFWQFGDPASGTSTQQNPTYTYPQPGCYPTLLTITDAAGCTDTISETFCFEAETSLYIPNSFTPGGDGKNEIFIPAGENISSENYLFRVYNRWGEMIFETRSPAVGWDGTYKGRKVQIDTYVWTLQYTDANNRTRQDIGHVNVIR
jgi:gliding motility-associated-like protein